MNNLLSCYLFSIHHHLNASRTFSFIALWFKDPLIIDHITSGDYSAEPDSLWSLTLSSLSLICVSISLHPCFSYKLLVSHLVIVSIAPTILQFSFTTAVASNQWLIFTSLLVESSVYSLSVAGIKSFTFVGSWLFYFHYLTSYAAFDHYQRG